MGLTRFTKRLLRDTSGQVLLFGAVLVLAILAFLLAMPNGTRATTQKVRAQTSADVGAFTGSVWLARSLNLTANLNIGIRSVYTWITVLTVSEALAQALYSDTADASVQTLGANITSALFGNANPDSVHKYQYPSAIRKLDTTALWLYQLQDDIATSFTEVAARMGTDEASRNMGGSSLSPTAGGWALVHTNDSVPLLDTSYVGDSLLYDYLSDLPAALDTIPTLDSNITPATGLIIIDPNTWDVWAYYSDTSNWYDVKQFFHYYMFWIMQVFRDSTTGKIDTQYAYFADPGLPPFTNFLNAQEWPKPRAAKDSWAPWSPFNPYVGRHTPPGAWQLLKVWPGGDNKYKLDTFFYVSHRLPKWQDTTSWINGDSQLPHPKDWDFDSTILVPTDFFSGAESTVGYKGAPVRPRRVNPDRAFHTVSYVWRQGASSSPYGLGPPLGGSIFPRSAVAAASPLFSVARAVPFLAGGVTDFFFEPGWDARLTALDSVGVADITSDTAFASHTMGHFDNLEDLRKHVLLP